MLVTVALPAFAQPKDIDPKSPAAQPLEDVKRGKAEDDDPMFQPWNSGVPPWRLKQHHRYRVWDPYLDPREGLLSVTYAIEQPFHGGEKAWGIGLSLAQSVQTYYGPLMIRGQLHYLEGRIHDKTILTVGLPRYQFFGGLSVGPVEIGAGPGITGMHVDLQRWKYPSLGFFSPRIAAMFALKIGVARLEAEAFTEINWRWVGRDTDRVYGFVFTIGGGGQIGSKHTHEEGADLPRNAEDTPKN